MIRRKDLKLEHLRLDSIHESVGCASTLKQLTRMTMAGVVDDHIVDELTEECFVPDGQCEAECCNRRENFEGRRLGQVPHNCLDEKRLFKDSTMFILSSESH